MRGDVLPFLGGSSAGGLIGAVDYGGRREEREEREGGEGGKGWREGGDGSGEGRRGKKGRRGGGEEE